MNNEDIINIYSLTKECLYKGETYSVRDNGAVLRHIRPNKPKRKIDGIWTFGKPNSKNGYMMIGSERVHRVVAFAFLGNPPTPQHVVDHIDTNRRNNRPENLRWLTKLENVLNNPITRKKIEYLCGSIETFINDPSIIEEFANDNPSYSWMRSVTPEEAKNTYERLIAWTKKESKSNTKKGMIGEWVYQSSPINNERPTSFSKGKHGINNDINFKNNPYSTIEIKDKLFDSLTMHALQKNWKTPTKFPLCPSIIDKEPLLAYLNNLKKGKVISINCNNTHYIIDYALCNNERIAISTYTNTGVKRYSLITVTFINGKFVHEGTTFFQEEGAQKALTKARGAMWDGGDVFDDYC